MNTVLKEFFSLSQYVSKNILSYTIQCLNTALMTVKGHTSLAYSTQYNHRSMQHDNKIVVRTQYCL